jgi:hypothetical protein
MEQGPNEPRPASQASQNAHGASTHLPFAAIHCMRRNFFSASSSVRLPARARPVRPSAAISATRTTTPARDSARLLLHLGQHGFVAHGGGAEHGDERALFVDEARKGFRVGVGPLAFVVGPHCEAAL